MVEFHAVTGGRQGLPENEGGTLVGLGGLGTLQPLPLQAGWGWGCRQLSN